MISLDADKSLSLLTILQQFALFGVVTIPNQDYCSTILFSYLKDYLHTHNKRILSFFSQTFFAILRTIFIFAFPWRLHFLRILIALPWFSHILHHSQKIVTPFFSFVFLDNTDWILNSKRSDILFFIALFFNKYYFFICF